MLIYEYERFTKPTEFVARSTFPPRRAVSFDGGVVCGLGFSWAAFCGRLLDICWNPAGPSGLCLVLLAQRAEIGSHKRDDWIQGLPCRIFPVDFLHFRRSFDDRLEALCSFRLCTPYIAFCDTSGWRVRRAVIISSKGQGIFRFTDNGMFLYGFMLL